MLRSTAVLRQQIESSLATRIPAALSVRFHPTPELISTGIAACVILTSPHHRFLIALHSPEALIETGLHRCPAEKSRDSDPFADEQSHSLQSGLPVNNREMRALFAYFGAERAGILCSLDCMAEREGFEPAVRFCRAKARRVRKLQIAKPYQRISHENPTSSFAISPVSIRHLFIPKRRTPGDSVARMVTLRGPQAGLMRFAGDCLPTAQSESEKSIRRECCKKANKWESSEILVHASWLPPLG
jgi:hypothetical protein